MQAVARMWAAAGEGGGQLRHCAGWPEPIEAMADASKEGGVAERWRRLDGPMWECEWKDVLAMRGRGCIVDSCSERQSVLQKGPVENLLTTFISGTRHLLALKGCHG